MYKREVWLTDKYIFLSDHELVKPFSQASNLIEQTRKNKGKYHVDILITWTSPLQGLLENQQLSNHSRPHKRRITVKLR